MDDEFDRFVSELRMHWTASRVKNNMTFQEFLLALQLFYMTKEDNG